MALDKPSDHPKESGPPFFKSWNQMYVFVLVLHAVIITLFYIVTKIYS